MPEKSVEPEMISREAAALRALFNAKQRELGLSQQAFGETYDIGTQGAVWQYLHGRSTLNLAAALKFARGLNVRVSDFSPRLAAELDAAGFQNDEASIARESGATYAAVRTSVPVVGTAQAGDEGYWLEFERPPGHGEGRIRYATTDANAYAVRVKGDSMRPRIKPGEFLVIEPHRDCIPGDEVLVRTKNGRSMVKLLGSQRAGLVELRSINDDHKPITLDVTEIEVMHNVAAVARTSAFIPDDEI
jgi:phage repressor protein C with HTH and peptisase S24 domain